MKLRQALKFFPIKNKWYKEVYLTDEFMITHFPPLDNLRKKDLYTAQCQKAYTVVRKYLKRIHKNKSL